jgi:hypothetical protein
MLSQRGGLQRPLLQPVEPVALDAQRQVETLRLLFPWDGWTLGYALLAGAERLFALAARDFEGLCAPRRGSAAQYGKAS